MWPSALIRAIRAIRVTQLTRMGVDKLVFSVRGSRLVIVTTLAVALGVFFSNGSAFAAAQSNPTDSGFAGYIASQPTVSTASVHFAVPAITCAAGSNLAMGEGVIVYGNSGTSTSSGGVVLTQCVNGTPTYAVSVAINGTKTVAALTVTPGDRMQVDAAESPTATSVKVVDHTTAKSFRRSAATGVTMTLAEIGVVGLGGTSGPPGFGSVSFSKGLVDGMALGSLSPAPAGWDWANAGVTVIHTTTISTTNVFKAKHV